MNLDYGAMGAMGGLLAPYLYKQLFGNSSATPNTATTNTKPATNIDVNNPTPAMLSQAQQLFPTAPQAQLPEWIKANPEMFQPGGNPYQTAATDPSKSLDLSKILGSLSGSSSGSGSGAAGSSAPVAIGQPAPQPNYGGGGPTPGSYQPITPQMLSIAMQMPGGGQGPSLGPAAMNPLLAMLKGRLGII